MAGIIDFVETYGRRLFSEVPLTSIDMVVINELGYLPLDQWAKATIQPVLIADLAQEIDQRYQDEASFTFTVNKDRIALIKAVIAAPRYKDLCFSHYVSILDEDFEKQFAAVVMTIETIDYCQVIFRGTDETVIGWKEDFKMTYRREIPAQAQAKTYLTEFLTAHPDKKVVVSGHSKGGNLGLFAAANLALQLKQQLVYILMLDAPGLHEQVLSSPGYQAVRHKVCALRPKESIVGSMLSNDVQGIFIDSQLPGILQHNVMAWETQGLAWALAPGPTELSQALEVTFREWTKTLGKSALKTYFDTIFDLFLDNDVDSIDDFRRHLLRNLSRILLAIGQLPADKRQMLLDSTGKLLTIFLKSQASQMSQSNPALLKDWQGLLKTYFK